jgi:hypothetical protein
MLADVVRRVWVPLRRPHQARLDQLESGEERPDLGPAAQRQRGRRLPGQLGELLSFVPCAMTRWLPGASRAPIRARIPAGSSVSGMACRMATSSSATGWAKSSMAVTSGWSTIASGRRRSSCTTVARSLPASSWRLCMTATGSMSTYTTRASGATFWATSCTLPRVGMPEPMSRNWRMPAPARCRAARCRKARLRWAWIARSGINARPCRISSRSAAKLWQPPSR